MLRALCDERIELFEPGAVGFDIFSACKTRFDEEGSDLIHPGSSTHVLDIDAVHPVELLFVKDRILARHAIE